MTTRVFDFGLPPHEYKPCIEWAFGVKRCPQGKAIAYLWNLLHSDLFKIPTAHYGKYIGRIGQAYMKHGKKDD